MIKDLVPDLTHVIARLCGGSITSAPPQRCRPYQPPTAPHDPILRGVTARSSKLDFGPAIRVVSTAKWFRSLSLRNVGRQVELYRVTGGMPV
jgi:hypothetical protein